MPLAACRTCGEQISRQATECPKCGAGRPALKAGIRGYFRQGETVEQRLKACHSTSGFDYLRLILAISVLCAHSIPICYGPHAEDIWIWGWPLKGPARMILCMFFALSGFLVTGSIFRTNFISGFIALRVLRLVPALTVEVILSAVLLGAFFTTLPLFYYFQTHGFWIYFLNIIGEIHFHLPGVFQSMPVSNNVNSNLWTLPAELKCYIILVFLMATQLIKIRAVILYTSFYATLALFARQHLMMKSGVDVGAVDPKTLMLCCFWGVTIYLYGDKVRLHVVPMCISAMIAIALLFSKDTALATPFATYTTVYLGLLNPRKLPFLLAGDYSYGIYLYSFPIQQSVCHLLPTHRHWWLNLLIAIPVTWAFAAFSWHGIEKHALRLKGVAAGNNSFLARTEHAFIKALKAGMVSMVALATTAPGGILSAQPHAADLGRPEQPPPDSPA
jgi:peptidoglycan/LPS O-acetylase OafA/YrhL